MLATLAAAVISTAVLVPQPDTTIAVHPGITLEVENFGGEIAVKTWDNDAVKIAADHSLRDQVYVEKTGSALIVKAKTRRWVPGSVNYRITVPRWMKLELSGVNTDISVENSLGEVRAETVVGDISLTGGSGNISVSSVQGAVEVKRTKGRIEASSVNQGVHVEDTVGPILAESVNGGIVLAGVHADSVDASTVNGSVIYEGSILDHGVYHIATHNGCIDIAVPENANVTANVSTFSGGIDSSFPVTLKKLRSKRFITTFGSGGAKLELESFQGTIYLRRPSEARSDCGSDDESEKDDREDRAQDEEEE